MSKLAIENTTLTAIANEVRAKAGTADPIKVSDLASSIANLPSGSSKPLRINSIEDCYLVTKAPNWMYLPSECQQQKSGRYVEVWCLYKATNLDTLPEKSGGFFFNEHYGQGVHTYYGYFNKNNEFIQTAVNPESDTSQYDGAGLRKNLVQTTIAAYKDYLQLNNILDKDEQQFAVRYEWSEEKCRIESFDNQWESSHLLELNILAPDKTSNLPIVECWKYDQDYSILSELRFLKIDAKNINTWQIYLSQIPHLQIVNIDDPTGINTTTNCFRMNAGDRDIYDYVGLKTKGIMEHFNYNMPYLRYIEDLPTTSSASFYYPQNFPQNLEFISLGHYLPTDSDFRPGRCGLGFREIQEWATPVSCRICNKTKVPFVYMDDETYYLNGINNNWSKQDYLDWIEALPLYKEYHRGPYNNYTSVTIDLSNSSFKDLSYRDELIQKLQAKNISVRM